MADFKVNMCLQIKRRFSGNQQISHLSEPCSCQSRDGDLIKSMTVVTDSCHLFLSVWMDCSFIKQMLLGQFQTCFICMWWVWAPLKRMKRELTMAPYVDQILFVCRTCATVRCKHSSATHNASIGLDFFASLMPPSNHLQKEENYVFCDAAEYVMSSNVLLTIHFSVTLNLKVWLVRK